MLKRQALSNLVEASPERKTKENPREVLPKTVKHYFKIREKAPVFHSSVKRIEKKKCSSKNRFYSICRSTGGSVTAVNQLWGSISLFPPCIPSKMLAVYSRINALIFFSEKDSNPVPHLK
ncbi:hypothetical protein AVEN_151382-1 [Araneus ventricosus]|uniref:Uncharacterized protein n=1 Tax=Araneus ventricosus TaxID=182803 RepID=A0A4Y2CA58_ARAVE|nr:hypothetical protein AVEN_151382-1 [Araneus ventricosus]